MTTTGVTKRCGRCRLDKPLDAFGSNKARADGKQVHCRACRVRTPTKPTVALAGDTRTELSGHRVLEVRPHPSGERVKLTITGPKHTETLVFHPGEGATITDAINRCCLTLTHARLSA